MHGLLEEVGLNAGGLQRGYVTGKALPRILRFGGEKLVNTLTYAFIGAETKKPLCTWIPTQDAEIQRDTDDGGIRALHDRCQMRLRLGRPFQALGLFNRAALQSAHKFLERGNS